MSDVELRLGDWQTALADVERVDALIVDPPYGERTHRGNDAVVGYGRADLDYSHWSPDDVRDFVASWSPRVTGWIVGMTSDDLIPHWREAFVSVGRMDFAPVPILQPRVRLGGDGPASSAVYMLVGRPRTREAAKCGALPGWYVAPLARDGVTGGKPLGLMRAIVRDYTRPGDLVADPCAGAATTLLAAAMEGRRAIGSERDIAHYQIAQKRLARGYTPPLFTE